MSTSKVPVLALVLMLAGIFPFLACVLIMAGMPEHRVTASLVLIYYAAIIFTFVGAVRWGHALHLDSPANRPAFIVSIVTALLAWGLLVAVFRFGVLPWFYLICAAGFAGLYLFDTRSVALPSRYRRWRIWPTLGAILSLISSYVLLSWA